MHSVLNIMNYALIILDLSMFTKLESYNLATYFKSSFYANRKSKFQLIMIFNFTCVEHTP